MNFDIIMILTLKWNNMKTITLKNLIDLKACQKQVDLFIQHFGESAKVTEANCIKAGLLGFDINWLADKTLSPKGLKKYNKALKPLWDEYLKARNTLYDEYYKALKPLDDEYYKALKPLRDEYNKALKPLWDEYLKARGLAFYNAILID